MVSDESAVLYRIGSFGLIAGVVYWFVSYEWLGTAALVTLGLGPLFGGVAVGRLRRGPDEPRPDVVRRLVGFPRTEPPGARHALEADQLMIIPAPSVWPLVLSLGVAVTMTGLIFGAWLLLLGGLLMVWGLWGWVAAVSQETALGWLRGRPAPTDQSAPDASPTPAPSPPPPEAAPQPDPERER